MWHVGETKTLSASVAIGRDSVDAPEITLRWKVGANGEEHIVTPDHDGTGLYSARITPDAAGILYARWDSDGDTDVVSELRFRIKESAFEI